MDNIIDEKKNLSKKIIYSSILSVIIFIIIGNLSLINLIYKDVSFLSRFDILKKGFSMSILDVGFLYITFQVLIYTVLKNKKRILKNYVKAKNKKNTILINKIKFSNQILLISLSINLLIKFILYCVLRKKLITNFNIGFDSLFTSLVYTALISLILYLMTYLSFICIKDFISGTLAYCMIFANLSVVLGIGSIFISDKISFVRNILDLVYSVYNAIIEPFYAFYTVYSKQLFSNIVNMLVLAVVVLLIVYSFKKGLENLNKDNIKKYYINKWFRKIFYASTCVCLSYVIFLIGFLSLISFNFINYDMGLLLINLLQGILCIALYIKLDKVYLNKESLKKEKVKAEIKEKNKLNIIKKNKKVPNNLLQNLENMKQENTDEFYKNIISELNLENELKECEIIKNYAFSESNELDKQEFNEEDREILDLLNDDSIVKS